MSTLTDYEKEKRTGGRKKVQPKVENKYVSAGPSLWQELKNNFSWTPILIAVVLAFSFLLLKTISTPKDQTFFGSNSSTDKIMTKGFNTLGNQVAALSANISDLIVELRNKEPIDVRPNPDMPIASEPIVKWKTRWRIKRVKNPVNEDLRQANRILTSRARALENKVRKINHAYRLHLKMISDFYAKPLQAGFKRSLTYSGGCGPVDNYLNPPIINETPVTNYN